MVLYMSSQGVHGLKRQLAANIVKVPDAKVRVVTRDVGGGFGMKIFLYPEQPLVMWAAKKVGRPVKWTGDRAEAFTSDTQGRDHVQTAEVAMEAAGRFLAMRFPATPHPDAYLSTFRPTATGSRIGE